MGWVYTKKEVDQVVPGNILEIGGEKKKVSKVEKVEVETTGGIRTHLRITFEQKVLWKIIETTYIADHGREVLQAIKY